MSRYKQFHQAIASSNRKATSSSNFIKQFNKQSHQSASTAIFNNVQNAMLIKFDLKKYNIFSKMDIVSKKTKNGIEDKILEEAIQYKFKNKEIKLNALLHPSEKSCNGNTLFQKYEFLGDRVLALVVAEFLLNDRVEMNLKALSLKHSNLVNSDRLAKIGKKLKLEKFLKHSIQILSDSVLADAVEAIIGGIFLDGGYEKAENFILSNLEECLYTKEEADYKNMLQEYAQARGWELPIYTNKGTPNKNDIYEVEVRIKECGSMVGEGKNTLIASKNAAQKLMRKIETANSLD